MVVHEKKDDGDASIATSYGRVIDLRRCGRSATDHNYRKHEIVARELEREFGHERVQGAHIERDGKARPERTPSHAEMQQAERTRHQAGGGARAHHGALARDRQRRGVSGGA